MDDLLDSGRKTLNAQPFSRLLNAHLVRFGDQAAWIELELTAELRQQNGFAHGGVLSNLADNALTFAGGLALGPQVLTSEFKINYIRPALGSALVEKASVVHAGRRQAVCRCDVFARDADVEKLVAAALSTITKIDAASETSEVQK